MWHTCSASVARRVRVLCGHGVVIIHTYIRTCMRTFMHAGPPNVAAHGKHSRRPGSRALSPRRLHQSWSPLTFGNGVCCYVAVHGAHCAAVTPCVRTEVDRTVWPRALSEHMKIIYIYIYITYVEFLHVHSHPHMSHDACVPITGRSRGRSAEVTVMNF